MPSAAAPVAGQTTAALALPALSLTPAAATKPEAAPQAPPEQAADGDASLPPDAPIEPGSGPPPRSRSTRHRKTARSSAGPIASERVSRPPFRSNFIVAARRAAQAASEPNDPRSDASAPIADADPGAVSQKLAERVKTMFVSTSLVLVGLGAAGIALSSADLIGLGRERLAAASHSAPIAQVALPTTPPSRLPATSETAPSVLADPLAIVTPFPTAPQASPDAPPTRFATPRTPAETVEATGSIGSQGNGSRAAASSAGRSWSEMLPAPMATKPLLAGIAERNPAAAYEIGMRYVEGRGVPSDIALAAVWFARAAEGGLALAQFRLGSMYEKGLGVKRNPSEARRLYFAAAAQGHAVAMHNIAVLYAEGIDGKPDFTQAAEWFQKAAEYGVGDSQFNLAVLYARGSGVEQNLVESFKWFSIAADKGDKDAAAKRDEIALHLDPETIAETRRAAGAFVPKPQPQEAMTAPIPPDGWDDADPAKPKPRTGNLYRRVQRA
jgi:localization factor PodJL